MTFDPNENSLEIFAVWDHPADYPDWYVVRPQYAKAGVVGIGPVACIGKNLDELRAPLEEAGLACLSKQPGDEPNFIEAWL